MRNCHGLLFGSFSLYDINGPHFYDKNITNFVVKSAFVTECVMISNDKIQEMTFVVRKISLKCLEMS